MAPGARRSYRVEACGEEALATLPRCEFVLEPEYATATADVCGSLEDACASGRGWGDRKNLGSSDTSTPRRGLPRAMY
jgi:hypothetical protein